MELKQRHGCVTAWLIIMLIANASSAMIYFFANDIISGSLPVPISDDMLMILGMVAILNLLFAVMLLQWKKWAFWGFVGTTTMTFAINISLGLGVSSSILGFLGIAMLYGILQVKKDGIPAWDKLE